MSSPGMFNELFVGAHHIKSQKLGEWFDQKSATFGGQSAIEAVKALVGHASRFDLSGLKEVPNVDLSHLQPFFENVLVLNRRRPMWTDTGLSFKTPDDWLDEPGIRKKYEGMVFDRTIAQGQSAEKVLGVGHKVFDKALKIAAEFPVSLAWSKDLEHSLVVFQIYDRVTDQSGRMRQAIVDIECGERVEGSGWQTLRDWEVLERLNKILPREKPHDELTVEVETLRHRLEHADQVLADGIASLCLPFKIPEWKAIGVLWSVAR